MRCYECKGKMVRGMGNYRMRWGDLYRDEVAKYWQCVDCGAKAFECGEVDRLQKRVAGG